MWSELSLRKKLAFSRPVCAPAGRDWCWHWQLLLGCTSLSLGQVGRIFLSGPVKSYRTVCFQCIIAVAVTRKCALSFEPKQLKMHYPSWTFRFRATPTGCNFRSQPPCCKGRLAICHWRWSGEPRKRKWIGVPPKSDVSLQKVVVLLCFSFLFIKHILQLQLKN